MKNLLLIFLAVAAFAVILATDTVEAPVRGTSSLTDPATVTFGQVVSAGIGGDGAAEVSADTLGFTFDVVGWIASFNFVGDSCATVFAWDLTGDGETDATNRSPRYHYGKLGKGVYPVTVNYGGGKGAERCTGQYTRPVKVPIKAK